jgi:acyl-CoA synthetase (AMP-forming)/AMP-acid ligase II
VEVSGATAGLVEEQWLGTTVRCYADRPLTLIHALDLAVQSHPDVPAVVDADRTVTYAELAELVEAAGERLAEEGLQPGDRLAVAFRNSLDAIVAIWACARAGFVFVGLPTRMQPAQWTYVLEHSGPSLVLGHEEFFEGLQTAAAQAGLDASRVRLVEDVLTGKSTTWRGDAIPFPDQDTSYATVYTSGTTGRPKAIALVHRCTIHSAIAYIRLMGLTAGDRTAITFPLYYVTGHVAQVTPMMLIGGTSYPVVDLSPAELTRLCREQQISYLMVTPSFWPLLLRDPGFRWPDLAATRIGAFGGSPVPLSAITALRERMPQLRLYDAYGLSETHSPATILLDHEFARRPGSIGRPVPCCDVRIVDENGKDRPVGEAGELLIKGPNITTGYVGDPEGTAKAIVDGWLHTGDFCKVDDEGFVYLLDRIKDVVLRGGFKVYSVELEYLLVSHPSIEQAAVFGVPDPLAYEAVCAYVRPTAGASITAAEIRSFVRQNMADYAVPRWVRIVDEIPRNRTGKIEKALLRAQLTEEIEARRT